MGRQMGRRTLLLITSILLAAVGTALIAIYVKGADSRAQQGEALVSAYVVKSKVAAGTPVGQIPLSTMNWHQSDMPAGAVTSADLKEISADVTATDLLPGQVLQTGMFTSPGAATSAIDVEPNNVAASFQLTDPQRVASLLEPGMKVTVFKVPNQGTSAPLLTKVKVIRVGAQGPGGATGTTDSTTGSATGSSDSPVASTIITFDLSPSQEAKMLDAQRDGTLALGIEASGSAS
jgi:pilus assembly protein CpaB